jgi:hypothetical protein
VPKKWEKQESRLANLIGGTRNAGSGSGWVRKADVRNVDYLIEAKTTENKGYRLTLQELLTLGHQADVEGRTPAFCVEIQGHNYVVLREQDWNR